MRPRRRLNQSTRSTTSITQVDVCKGKLFPVCDIDLCLLSAEALAEDGVCISRPAGGAEKSVLIKTRYSQTTFDKILDGDWRQSNEQAAKAICGGNGHQSLGIISMALLANDRLLAVVAPAPDADASSNL